MPVSRGDGQHRRPEVRADLDNTCAAQTTATSLAGVRANAVEARVIYLSFEELGST